MASLRTLRAPFFAPVGPAEFLIASESIEVRKLGTVRLGEAARPNLRSDVIGRIDEDKYRATPHRYAGTVTAWRHCSEYQKRTADFQWRGIQFPTQLGVQI